VATVVPGAEADYWKRFGSDVRRVLFPLMSGPGRQRAEPELTRVEAMDPGGTVLVHGDLGGSNLLWNEAPSGPRLTGILDWDGAHLGSPAEDVASLAVTFGWPLAERLSARWMELWYSPASSRVPSTAALARPAAPAAAPMPRSPGWPTARPTAPGKDRVMRARWPHLLRMRLKGQGYRHYRPCAFFHRQMAPNESGGTGIHMFVLTHY
jgi:hypothetical protein